MDSQSHLVGLSQSCQKSLSSAYMLKRVVESWSFASSSVLQIFHKCSFHFFQKFSPIFVRFMNYLKYIIKYLKHSQTLVLITIIITIYEII